MLVCLRRASARRRLVGAWLLGLVCFSGALSLSAAEAAPRAGDMKSPPAPLYAGERALNVRDAHLGLPAAVSMREAVRHALKFNPSLGAQESQSRSSEEGRKSARGAFGPKLGMSYTAVKQEKKTSPASTRPPELGTYSWAVEISQPVFQGFRLLAAYQKAALQADSDKAALRNAELAMTEQVQTYFLNYLRAEENVRSERDALARLRDQLRITNAFYDVGLRPRLDVLQAEVNVSQAENLLIQAENNRDTFLAMLNTLLGLPATARANYTGRLAHVPFRRSLEQCLEAAYRQRPDLYMAARSVEIAGKDQRMVQSEYYPQVEAYYNINQTGNTPDLQKSGDRGSRGSTWEVGARATWNAFQWGATYYADKQAGWLVTKMRYEEENLKLNVGYDIKSKLLAVHEAEKRISVAEKGVEQAREAYSVALARYQEQVGTNFDVLDASSKLTTAQASLTGAKADYLTALAQIYVAMGEFHPDLMQR
ncbi:TolC family protein [Desulfovibrio sp. SGI.169]|uniref:TolC family protein n=1 Tax=Desulfovibrio sp. SGI.169 TaxID=3420561 RepID=UPI003D033F87